MKYASNMQTPLVSVVLQQCARLLSRARLDETLNHALRLELENVHARLKIWAGNVGAFAPGNASVDYRLREDPDVADVVVSMLKSLRSSLEQAISPPLVEEEEEDDSRMTSQMPMETASISSDKTASSPALSLDSEVTGSDDGVTTKTDKHDDSRGSEEALRKANDIISRLYQLASVIRKPESSSENARVRDFMTKLKSKGETFDVEDAQDHAQSHLLARFPNTPPFLAQRLVSAVVFRRMKLRYRQRHRDKLRQGIVDSFDSGHASDAEPERPAAPAESPSGPLGGQYGDRGAAQGVRGAQQQQRPSRTIFSATNASSVNRQQFPNYARSTALSGITRSAVPRRQKLDVPTPPQNIDEGLKKMECKFCMRIISSEERQEPRWTYVSSSLAPSSLCRVCLIRKADVGRRRLKSAHIERHRSIHLFVRALRYGEHAVQDRGGVAGSHAVAAHCRLVLPGPRSRTHDIRFPRGTRASYSIGSSRFIHRCTATFHRSEQCISSTRHFRRVDGVTRSAEPSR